VIQPKQASRKPETPIDDSKEEVISPKKSVPLLQAVE
jgi:hypothetical protein